MNESNLDPRIQLAIPEQGRLTEDALNLLKKCDLEFLWSKDRRIGKSHNFPMDLMTINESDIPRYVFDGVCDLGILEEIALHERLLERSKSLEEPVKTLQKLGGLQSRLVIALPRHRFENHIKELKDLRDRRIATPYPETLKNFLDDHEIRAEIVQITSSAELAPALEVSDAVADLVSTGTTLKANGLVEMATVLKSTGVLVQTKKRVSMEKDETVSRLVQRIRGVQKAASTKFILMKTKRSQLEEVQSVIPGLEVSSSAFAMGQESDEVTLQAVCREQVFWETLERLKGAGARSIRVLPIEKIVD